MKNCLRTRLARGLEHLLFWVTQRAKEWRRIEEERNPFGKVDADRWEWRQAGQSATEEGCVCVVEYPRCVCTHAHVCACLDEATQITFPWLIWHSIRLTCRMFQNSADVGGGGEMSREREKTRKKERGERKIKINSAESITGNSTDRGAEVVKSY